MRGYGTTYQTTNPQPCKPRRGRPARTPVQLALQQMKLVRKFASQVGGMATLKELIAAVEAC